jgi:DnaJ-class molecular chaperone
MTARRRGDDGSEDDYYALLGVDAGADAEALRLAWRRVAATWHPDRAGADAAATFQRCSGAYELLSDPLARAAYDRRRRGRVGAGAVTTSTANESSPGEPRSQASSAARSAAPGEMLERLSGPLNLLLACGAARYDDDGMITLVVGPGEAARGGMVTISMRVEVWCPACASPRGLPVRPMAASCARCDGGRTVEELYSAWLAVPPGIRDGEVLVPSVELPDMVERARFRVRLGGR